MGSAFGIVLALLFLSLSALCATITVATQGYRALTREEVAARVVVNRLAPKRFSPLALRLPMAGRKLLGWPAMSSTSTPTSSNGDRFVNILGLHTAYELDRVAGRYIKVEDEQSLRRTVYALTEEKTLDMYDLRSRFPVFKPLVDAEYGSATFIAVEDWAEFEVRVSTTGLLIRRLGSTGRSRPATAI